MTWLRPTSARPAGRAALRAMVLTLAGLSLTVLNNALVPVGAAAAGSCTLFWTGATDTTWSLAANWSTNTAGTGSVRTPVSSDVVCVATAPLRATATYTSLTRTVAGIDFSASGSVSPQLTIDGGRLTVGSGSGSVTSTINDLTILDGGSLQGSADHILTGRPVLDGNAVLDGPGTTTLAAGTVVDTDGLVISNGRRLVVAGTLRHTGCYDYVYVYGNAILENAGRIVADSDCGMRIYADPGDGSLIRVDAGAVLEIDQTAAETYVLQGPLENHGTVQMSAGTLIAAPTSTPDGSWALGTSAELRVASGGTLRIRPGTLTGRNAVTVDGGTVNGDSGVTIGAVDLRAGQLTGSPIVADLDVAPSGVITGGGTVTIAGGGSGEVDGLVVSGGTIVVNKGTLHHTACTAPIQLRSGSVLRNEGQFRIDCQSSISDDGSAGALVRNAATGTITVAMPVGVKIYTMGPSFTNDGSIAVTLGQFEVPRLTNFAAGTLTGGTYSVVGGKLVIPGNLTTNAANLTVLTPGELYTPGLTRALLPLRTNSGSLTVSGNLNLTSAELTNAGSLTVSAYTFKPKIYTQTAGITTIVSGATLTGGNGPGFVSINAGTLTGGGRLSSIGGTGTTRPTMTLSTTGQYSPSPAATLQIDVNSNSSAGRLAAHGSATVTGRLAIVTKAGFTPANGTSWTILTSSRRTGEFTQVTGDDLPGSLYYSVSYGTSSITLTVKRTTLVSVDDAAIEIGPAGAAPLDFLVTLDEPSSRLVTVDYATVDGSAVSGLDFLPTAGTLAFPPGTSSLPVVVMIMPDLGAEPDESFTLDLLNPTAAVLERTEATGWITHDGGAPAVPLVTGVARDTLGLGAYQVERTVLGANFLPTTGVSVTGTGLRVDGVRFVDAQTLVVLLSAPTAATLGANDVTVTNPGLGTATCAACLRTTPRPRPADTGLGLATGASGLEILVGGQDFVPGAIARLTGGSGVSTTSQYLSPSSIRLTVSILETASLTPWDVRVTNPDDGVGVCTGCFTVLSGPSFTSMAPGTVARNSSTTVTLTGSGFQPGATLVPALDVAFGDVTVLSSTQITATMDVAAGRGKGTGIPVTVVNPVAGGGGSAKCLCLAVDTMIDAADTATTVGLTGPVGLTFDVRLDATSTGPVSVDYTTADGTALAGSDYTATSGRLTFPPGTTSLPVLVTVLPDPDVEPDETFTLQLANPSGASLTRTSALALVRHADGAVPAPVLTGLSPGTVGVGAVARQVTLTGLNFRATSAVSVSGTGVAVAATRFVDTGTIEVTLSAWTTALTGTRDVTVTTPDRGVSTCAGCLRVTPAPVATTAGPSLGQGATERLVSITGTGFVDGAVAIIRGGSGIRVLSTTVQSSTSLVASVTVASSSRTGLWDVRLTNPDAGTAICTGCFTVVGGPTVVSVTPPALLRGTTVPVTILGSGFVQGAVVNPPPGVRVTNVVVVSGSLITALATVDPTRGRADNLPVTVVNPASAGWGQSSCSCLSVVVVVGR